MSEQLAARLARGRRGDGDGAPRPGARVISDGTAAAPHRRDAALAGRGRGAPPKVVALGGGHGLSASLSALRRITGDLTAVVTVADDGGSSGRLRAELGVLPPGDLRMALAALCGDDEWGRTWAQVFQHRFASGGDLHGHAVGNLLIVALWEQLGRPGRRRSTGSAGCSARTAGCCRCPRCRWTSYAVVRGLDPARPDAVSHRARPGRPSRSPRGEVQSVRLRAGGPAGRARRRSQAVLDADWVVLGPGSWFTSVHAAPAGAGAGRRRCGDQGPPGARAQPRAAAGGDRGLLPAASPRGSGGARPELAVDVVLADEAAVPRAASSARRGGSARWAPTRRLAPVADAGRRRGTTRSCWPPRTTGFFVCMEGSAHGDDGSGEGRAQPAPRHPDLLPQGGGLGDPAVRRRSAHRERPHRDRGGAGHRDRGAAAAQGHPGGLRARLRAGRDGARRAAPRQPLRGAGGRRTATSWPGRPAWSTAAAGPSAGCRRRSSRAPPATPRRPGAARSWRTAR